jgi:hypothetical protein
MNKNILFIVVVCMSSIEGFQRLRKIVGTVKNVFLHSPQSMLKSIHNPSIKPSSFNQQAKAFTGDKSFFCIENPASNFFASGIKPVIKSSFLTNMRDLATQLWHKFGIVEKYLAPIFGVRVLAKDRAFAHAAKEVTHNIIEIEEEYKTKLQNASDDMTKISVITAEFNLLSKRYEDYAFQISSFPYNEISYLNIVLYHVYTAKLLYHMKRDVVSIQNKTDLVFELEPKVQELVSKIDNELRRLQEFFDEKYKNEKKIQDSVASAGLTKIEKELKKIEISSNDIDFPLQFDESVVLDYFMGKLFNAHDREVVSLVVNNTLWIDRQKNDYYKRVRKTKDPIEKIKVSIEKLRELNEKDYVMNQRFVNKDSKQMLTMIDDLFCRKERDDLNQEIQKNVESFRLKYNEKISEQYEKLYKSYEAQCESDLRARDRILKSLRAEIVQLRNERRRLLNTFQLSQKFYLDPRYCEKLINSAMYENTLKILERLETYQK